MKLKRKKSSVIAIVMISIMMVCLFINNVFIVFADDNTVQAENLDIVFVIDDTRSMIENDPNKLSGSAIRQALTMIPSDRISNGSVRIGIGMYAIDMLPNTMELGSVKDVSAIYDFTDKAIIQDGKGTDAAQGIDWAVKQLDTNKDPNHEYAIVLIGDGENSYMVGGQNVRTDADSNKVRDVALAQAKAEGYRIFTMAINPTSSVFSEYFKNIAEQTGGKAFEPKTAADVATCIQEMLGSNGTSIPIPSREIVSRPQDIPVGTFEFDITCNHSSPIDITLISPSGVTYDKNSDGLEYREDTGYTGYKIFEPESGTWTVKFYSDVEQYILYNTIAHTDISLNLSCNNADIRAKEENTYSVNVLLQNKDIESDNVIKNLECKIIATNLADKSVEEVPMVLNGLKYEVPLTIEKKGQYEIKAQLHGKEFTVESNTLNVDIVKNSSAYILKIAVILGLIAIIAIIAVIILILRLVKKSPDIISLRIKMKKMSANDSVNGYNTFYIESDELATGIFRNKKSGNLADIVNYFKSTYVNIQGDESINSYINRDIIDGCRNVEFKGTKEKACYVIIPPSLKIANKVFNVYSDGVKVSSTRKIKFSNNSKFTRNINIEFRNKEDEKEHVSFDIELIPLNGANNTMY